MPTAKREDAKKHGDKLETLIDRTAGNEPEEAQGGANEDPAQLQDDDDEDVDNDDAAEQRDVSPRH